MQLNADFSKRAVVHGASLDWVESPMAGVDRRMLDRIGDEVARATSIVRYAPGSHFSPHVHTGGEEFLVLEGVFQDEHGDFPAGSYIRNPPNSSHTPGSEPGCVIFVKLWQFDLADRTHVRIDANKMASLPALDRPGVSIMPLFHDPREDVRLERWAPGIEVALPVADGIELLVLDGSFTEGGVSFVAQSWLRLPRNSSLEAKTGPDGCRVWIKQDHLRETPQAPGNRPRNHVVTSRNPTSLPASTGVLVVGGGLSGLHSAWRLAEAGIDCVLVEARDRFGGRVLSEPADHAGNGAGFDLGPAWFWPGQSRMETLVAGLGLQAFPQYDRGDLVFENPDGQVARYPGIAMMGGSLRLAGGLGRMIAALAAKLPAQRLVTGKRLTGLQRAVQSLVATIADQDGQEHSVTCERVLLALPPRLIAAQIACDPVLPAALLAQLTAIPTWMAGHAKVVALYDRPFWRDEGLSGDASSRRGPLMEIHDASPSPVSSADGTTGALFGFVGIPAVHRAGRDGELLAATREQLARLFGKAAGSPLQLLYKDWAAEPFTAVPADADPPSAHPAYGMPRAAADLWNGRLILSGTETASQHGGFLEGALEASETALRSLLPAGTAATQV